MPNNPTIDYCDYILIINPLLPESEIKSVAHIKRKRGELKLHCAIIYRFCHETIPCYYQEYNKSFSISIPKLFLRCTKKIFKF